MSKYLIKDLRPAETTKDRLDQAEELYKSAIGSLAATRSPRQILTTRHLQTPKRANSNKETGVGHNGNLVDLSKESKLAFGTKLMAATPGEQEV